jgi:hypothetical protein
MLATLQHMNKYSRRRFLRALGSAGILVPAASMAGIIVQSGPKYRTDTPPVGPTLLDFPNQSPGFISVLPGRGGVGMTTPGGTGRGLTGGARSARYLIDDLGTGNTVSLRPELGPRTWSGTFEGCWRANPPALDGGTVECPKTVRPIISGWHNSSANIPLFTGTAGRRAFFSYWGQFAPLAGFWLRGTRPHLNGMSDCVVMHMRSFIGDDDAGLGSENRDPFGSGAAGVIAARICMICNEFGFGVDEAMDMYRAHSEVTWLWNFFGPGLMDSRIDHVGDPTNEPHGFGPINGGDTSDTGSFTMFGNAFGDYMGRCPATTSTNFCVANNLYYNCGGRPGGGNSEAIDIWSQNQSNPRIANILHNWFVRGPENTSTPIAVRVRNGAAGTIGCLLGNAAHGWTMANQAAFLDSDQSGYLQGSLTSAIPGSFNGLAGVLQRTPSTSAEWHEIIDLMDSYVGACAANRVANTPAARYFQRLRARINGGSTAAQFVDTVQQWTSNSNIADPYWSVASTLINPTDPGSAWFAPLDTSSTWDTPLVSATFSNGMDASGRSPDEINAIETHWMRTRKPTA